MKLGLSYIVFDGIELLENSILQIKKHIDYLQIVYQEYSWFGKPIKSDDKQLLENIYRSGLADELTTFSDFEILKDRSRVSIEKSKIYESKKRQMSLDFCLSKNCTHFLCMDVDEFYLEKEFLKAKNKIIENNYEMTAVHFINYVNLPTIHRGFDKNKVPFICKINENTKSNSQFFVKCDRTRGLSCEKSSKNYLFLKEDIKMHHMETIRKDLYHKYISTTRKNLKIENLKNLVNKIKEIDNNSESINFEKIIFPDLDNQTLYKCENIFNIDIK